MKIALICPSNMLYMPYVDHYIYILKKNNVEYDILNWDRLHLEDIDKNLSYRDSKKDYKRSLLDYYKYNKFIINKLNFYKYDKIVVFGIQLTFFLRNYLIDKYKNKYVVDIRDHNKIMHLFNFKRVVESSAHIVISSPGYKKWLPTSDKYIINHNTHINSLKDLNEVKCYSPHEKINISYIGALRDFKTNIEFIESLKNDKCISLYYHGEGNINEKLGSHLNKFNIKNVFLTGRYSKKDEKNLYSQTNLVNVLIPDNHINSKTLLPNRLYNAAVWGKPVIALNGTYLAELIKKYDLGIIINSYEEAEQQIRSYLHNFNKSNYEKGRIDFFSEVLNDNYDFSKKISNFITRL